MPMRGLQAYLDLMTRKGNTFAPRGIDRVPALSTRMFRHQAIVTEFLLRAGCGAAFLDTGLGKSLIALEWARHIRAHTGRPVLMLAPLAVGPQHQREAEKFGIDAQYLRSPPASRWPDVAITNYERMHLFDPGVFGGVVLDESSILKSFAGKTKQGLIDAFRETPYRLACTATPAPNDHMELGNHAEFLGVMKSNEMLSRWFVNDTSMASQKWRLKGHAVGPFWDWVASWARCVAMPSDIGCPDDGFRLPDLFERRHVVRSDLSQDAGDDDGQGRLFRTPDLSATGMHKEKARSIDARADILSDIIAQELGEPWVVWCDTNAESDAMMARLPKDAIEVRGSMSADEKEDKIVSFSEGKSRIIVTKSGITGFGLNWQHCARMAFVGLSFSYEGYYQAVRRCWRFGQTRPVHVHVAMADTEKAIFDAVTRKSEDHDAMKREMTAAMRRAVRVERQRPYDAATPMRTPEWLA